MFVCDGDNRTCLFLSQGCRRVLGPESGGAEEEVRLQVPPSQRGQRNGAHLSRKMLFLESSATAVPPHSRVCLVKAEQQKLD